jgi:hypothetical protein
MNILKTFEQFNEELTNEKKKMNAGLRAFLDKKNAKKEDKDDDKKEDKKEDKEDKKDEE